MSVRAPDVAAAVFSVRRAEEPPQQRELHWLPAHRSPNVSCTSPSRPDMAQTLLTWSSRNAPQTVGSNYDRPNRLKGREDTIIRWSDLLEKFRSVQERARRSQRLASEGADGRSHLGIGDLRLNDGLDSKAPRDMRNPAGPPVPLKDATPTAAPPAAPAVKPRSGLGRQLGRFGGAVAGRGKRN